MKKISEFIVKKSKLVFIIVLVIAAFCAFLMPQVGMNTDMSKYLPTSSNMKQGVDVLAEEFPDMEMQNTIRVMVKGLDIEETDEYIEKLEAIKDVSMVTFEENEDYIQGDYTLFILSTSLAYDTPEEKAIQQAAKDVFAGYETETKNDNASSAEIPLEVILPAILILIGILFVMSASWLEPILFLITIGIAVVINMGTNIFMGSISGITFSVGAVLQLVLSMDYSIILMNRYRQERALLPDDKKQAMINAIKASAPSVFGSGMTTVVGLIMLVFMSFRIGYDLGIVLAKGVGISMLCVVFLLPCLVMMADKAIFRTGKKVPHPNMNAIAAFGYKFRHAITIGFAALFILCFFLQGNTPMTYTLFMDDPIADVFTRTNSVVCVYDNEDSDAVAEVGEELKNVEGVRNVTSYSLTLGKEYSSEELVDMMDNIGDSTMKIKPYMLDMIFYSYNNGETQDMTASEFLTFINEDVLSNRDFSAFMDEDIKKESDRLKYFDTKEDITQQRSAKALSDVLGMSESDIQKLFLLNRIENSDASARLSVSQLSDLISGITSNPEYAGMMPGDMAGEIGNLKKFTDKESVTTPVSYTEAASLLGADAQQMKMLYLYYLSADGNAKLDGMRLSDIVSTIKNLSENKEYSSMFDQNMKDSLVMLEKFSDKEYTSKQMSAQELASAMGMTASEAESTYTMYYGSKNVNSVTMTLNEYLSFTLQMADDPVYSANFDSAQTSQLKTLYKLTTLAQSGEKLNYIEMANALGIPQSQTFMVYLVEFKAEMSLTQFLDAASALGSDAQLSYMKTLCDTAAAGTPLSYTDVANLLGMPNSEAKQVFMISAGKNVPGKTMSIHEFVSFMLTEDTMRANMPSEQISQMETLLAVMNASASDALLSPADASAIFGVDESMMRTVFAIAQQDKVLKNKVPLYKLTDFIVSSGLMSGEELSQIKQLDSIIKATVSGEKLSYSQAADVLGMSKDQARMLYILYECENGNYGSMSLEQFVDLLVKDVLSNEEYAGMIEEDQKADLLALSGLIDAVMSGEKLSEKEMAEIMRPLGMDEGMVSAMYLYKASLSGDPGTMSIVSMLDYMTDDIFKDPAFSGFITAEQKADVIEIKDQLDEAVASLKSDNVSIMMIETKIPFEGEETDRFFDNLRSDMQDATGGGYYLIGTSAMSDEMKDSFDEELLLITLLTAIAIFVVVVITFKSVVVPALLVLLVQCGVYLTVILNGLLGYDMYYLALLMVQCILMGATIDYGILYSSYFKENLEKGASVLDALKEAFKGSMHTVLTSGLIIIIVTAIIGASPADPTITHILQAISLGAISAVVLIIFVLPGLLAMFSKFVAKKPAKKK